MLRRAARAEDSFPLIRRQAPFQAENFDLLEAAREVPTGLEQGDPLGVAQKNRGVILHLGEFIGPQVDGMREHGLRTSEIHKAPKGVVAAEIHQRSGAILFRIGEPVEEKPVQAGGAARSAVADNSMQTPDFAELTGIELGLERVHRGPPGHLVVHHHLDAVFSGEIADFYGILVRGSKRLLEDDVHVAGGAILDDLEMAVVLNESPDDERLFLVDHLAVIREDQIAAQTALDRFLNQRRFGFGHTHQPGGLAFHHFSELAPYVGVDHADNRNGGLLRR